MKKIIVLLFVSILILPACKWFASEKDAPQQPATNVEMKEAEDSGNLELEISEDEDEADNADEVYKVPSMKDMLYDYNAKLEDVTGGNATGFVGVSYDNDLYDLYAEFEDLPNPGDDYFYEGWVVRNNPLSVISTGKAINNKEIYLNSFATSQDLTDHDLYVLTLEPDDGDPAPAEHILEGTFQTL